MVKTFVFKNGKHYNSTDSMFSSINIRINKTDYVLFKNRISGVQIIYPISEILFVTYTTI